MVYCCIVGCRNRSGLGSGHRFFSIPTAIKHQCDKTRVLSTERRKLWLLRINRNDLQDQDVNKNKTVCDRHFISGAPSKLFDNESPDWAPSIALGYERKRPKILCRAKIKKEVTEVVEVVENTLESIEEPVEETKPLVEVRTDASCMTDETFPERPTCHASSTTDILGIDIENMKAELKMTRDDNIALRGTCQELQNKLNYCIIKEQTLQIDNDKVKFYTGIPVYPILKSVFDLVTKDVEFTLRNSLTPFQEFVMVLMRLRLNFLEQDLAYRFGVSQSTISRIILRWLPLMANRLRCFIAWPDRESLKAVVPQLFKDIFNDNVCVIMDCIEFHITKPSQFQHKKQAAAKFLIGITPQGSISFISRVPSDSDEDIMESCGILDHLSEGDVVIVNRDLNSREDVGFACGKVVYSDKPHLVFENLVPAKNLANLKKYMENIVGFVRLKYHILKETLPPEVLNVKKGQTEAPIDHIVVICCALANLCRSIVIDSTDKMV